MAEDPFGLFDEGGVVDLPPVLDSAETPSSSSEEAPAVVSAVAPPPLSRDQIIGLQTEGSALQALRAGTRFVAGDGEKFIRTNKYGTLNIMFCNTESGELCSAFDIIKNHGGLAALTDSSPF